MLNVKSNCSVGSLTWVFHIQIKDLQTDIFLIKSLITRQAIFNLTSTVEVLVVVPSSFFTISTEIIQFILLNFYRQNKFFLDLVNLSQEWTMPTSLQSITL